MVKVSGPMFSLAASGTLGKAVTFASWKGRPYVRERVVPSNPKSGAQVGRRAMLTFLSQAWAAVGTTEKATWQELADSIVAAPFNAYVKQNLEDWHNFLAPSDEQTRPGIGSGSDNDLSAAVWEENRVKLTASGSALGNAWGKIIFASLSSSFATAVGNAILVLPDTTIASHDIFWTPPSVTTWYFNIRTFADDGVLEAEGTEQTAAP